VKRPIYLPFSTKVRLVRPPRCPQPEGMLTRAITTLLWFLGGWTLGSLLSFFLGLPSGLDLVLSLALAVMVWWDPTERLWAYEQQGRSVDRRTKGLTPSGLVVK